jgi:glucokinase
LEIDAQRGAGGILDQIQRVASGLLQRFPVTRIGIGFGGPVDTAAGRVLLSHQVDGWRDFELVAWCQRTLGLPAVLGNDCDSAALAETRYGAGMGKQTVFYVTVGTGIGGGFVNRGVLHGAGRPAAAEIGHLRPGLLAHQAGLTVEALASGPGIAESAKRRAGGEVEGGRDLRERVGGDLDKLTAKVLGQAAADGNPLAIEVLEQACQVLGWAVAQMITLLAPEVVVVGGGVSLLGEDLFFAPLRRAVQAYVFPPLADACEIVPAALGEWVVVHGAIALVA